MGLIEIYEDYFVNSSHITGLYVREGECCLETTKHFYKIPEEYFNKIIEHSSLI